MNRFLRRALTIGLIGGVAMVHVSIIGMVEKFQTKNVVTDVLALGTVLPALIAFIVGYYVGGPWRHGARERPAPVLGLASGLAGGVAGGVVLSLFTWYVHIVAPRGIFPNATPRMVDILHFGQDAVLGSLTLIVVTGLSGLAGSALHVLPRLPARAVAMGLIVTLLVALMERFVGQILGNLPIAFLRPFFFVRSGLTPEGAAVLFASVAALTYAWSTRGSAVRETVRSRPKGEIKAMQIGAFVVLLVVLILLPQVIGGFLSETLVHVGTFVLLGLGLNIVVGYAGLLDLGYVAFYAVGAYTLAVLTSTVSVLAGDGALMNFWAALPFVMFAAAIAGLMIGAPVLRLRGDYLAIVTLGLGEIARLVLLSDWMAPYLGGAQGILSIPAPTLLGISFRQPQQLYYLVLFFCIVAAFAAISLANSRIGRAWTAMREDEVVAEATGINTHKYKLLAFMLGATFGCLAGAIFAVRIGSTFPHSFELLVSINALALIVLGGMGSIPGVIVGALVLVGLPELLREFADFRLLIYGAILIAMMILKPEGLLPNKARRAELHEHEDEAGDDADQQYEKRAGTETGAPVVT
jgi:branched-chain amino acid transport system permease protein